MRWPTLMAMIKNAVGHITQGEPGPIGEVSRAELKQAIDTEANARQGQVDELNAVLQTLTADEQRLARAMWMTAEQPRAVLNGADTAASGRQGRLNRVEAAVLGSPTGYDNTDPNNPNEIVRAQDGLMNRVEALEQGGGSLGVARTVYFNDQIQLTSGTPVSIDTGIVLKDGADYQIVISAMSGTTGSSASTGNGIMPQAIINGAAYGLAGNQNANALLNTVYRFRWQMHNMASNPANNIVGVFPLFGGTTISTVIYSSSANFDVDGAGISTTYGTQPSTLFRVQTPVADTPTLRLATTAAPTGNMRFMVKIIEQQSAFPTN